MEDHFIHKIKYKTWDERQWIIESNWHLLPLKSRYIYMDELYTLPYQINLQGETIISGKFYFSAWIDSLFGEI